MKEQLLEYANEIHPELIAIRRHLHMHPELSFQEIETGKYIASTLEKLEVSYTTGWAGHGVVADLGEESEKKAVYLRADIDALPILEVEDRSYRSTVDNKMHACGHDVHTTCLIGAIMILKKFKKDWTGRVRCLFQPGEEKLPGGASIMIKEGALESPIPSVVIGQHVHPPLEVGKVGFHPGPYMASADELYLTVIGKGGHAALVDGCINPLFIAAEMLIRLKHLNNSYLEKGHDVILNFGKSWTEGGATNVIPDKIHYEGTYRAMNEKVRFEMHSEMIKIAEELSEETKSKVQLEIKKGYPVLINDPESTNLAIKYSSDLLNSDKVVHLPKRMTSEDFSFYSHIAPVVFLRLGTGNKEKGIISPVHTPSFDVDEDCLKIGSSNMAYLAMKFLEQS